MTIHWCNRTAPPHSTEVSPELLDQLQAAQLYAVLQNSDQLLMRR
jgi:hypothetical protein